MSKKRAPNAPNAGPGSSASGALSEHEQAILNALSQVPGDDDDPQEMKTVIGGISPLAAPGPTASRAPAPVAEDPQEMKTIIGGISPLATPPKSADASVDHDQKTVIGGNLPKAPAGPLAALSTPPKPALAQPAPAKAGGDALAALSAPPKPAAPKSAADDDLEFKTIMLNPGATPTPEVEEEPEYKTIVLGGVSETPAAARPSAADDDAEYRTIIVDDSLLASGTNPGTTGAPGAARRSTDVFGKTATDAGATGTGHTGPSSPGLVSTGGTPTGGKPTLPEPGGHMAQYEVIRKLGEGGMGAVFLARDTRLGRRVAIKFLTSTNPELTQRFIIEARATARVEHENIVSIYEVGEWGGYPYMVLQFLQGKELSKIITRGKPMPLQRVIELMTPVLRALAYAHNEGIVHRDLKPDNIFVTDGGVTKVLDFGIAKVVQGDDKTTDGEGKASAEDIKKLGQDGDMTRHGALMGTMPFMSPEQWGNGVAIDHTTDIWAVGVMLYMMLSGKHPLYPLTGQELMVTGLLDEPTPSLREHAPDLPKAVVDVIDKCLKKHKKDRWPDALTLLRALEPLGRPQAASQALSFEESPYAGLSSFQEEDASRFFGRGRETAAMTQRLRERPLMAVVGPSGVGKSSFLRAGVVPALKNSGEQWDIIVIRPGRTPLMSLASLLLTMSGTSADLAGDLEAQQNIARRLISEPGYLGTALRRQARKDKKRILLFVDQFEELYTLVPDADERLAFTGSLLAAADDPTSPMRVVVSIRSDFLDRCVEDQAFMNELSQGLFFLTAPNRDGMREALVAPAQMAGYKFENDGIVNEMLDHLATTSGALPLLQFTADKLWAERDPGKHILTEASYRALGGITGALAAHAERTLEQLTPDQHALVRGLFLRLVTPERTRAIVSMQELKEALGKGKEKDVQTVIDLLVGARLLVVQTVGGGVATVEIVHESLIHGWPQLARWLDEGQEDSAFLEQMRNAARQWDAKGRDAGLLWRGEMVDEAKRFVRRFRGNLPDHQAAFLKAVIDNSTRAVRRKKVLYTIGAVVLLALLAAAAVALVVINKSRAETREQAVAAQAAEQKATALADEATAQRATAQRAQKDAEKAQAEAEKALADAKAADAAKEEARKKEAEALKLANMSKEQLEVALSEARTAEQRAVRSAQEASSARITAEQRAREALEARNAATESAKKLSVALKDVETAKAKAEASAAEAIRKLNEVTRGGVIEVLK